MSLRQELQQARRQVKNLHELIERERREAQSRDDDQRATIRRERNINERLTQDKFLLESKLKRCEDQRRAILLVLEEHPVTGPANMAMMKIDRTL